MPVGYGMCLVKIKWIFGVWMHKLMSWMGMVAFLEFQLLLLFFLLWTRPVQLAFEMGGGEKGK